jgi:hypothetical protein
MGLQAHWEVTAFNRKPALFLPCASIETSNQMFYERNKVLTMLEQKKILLGIQCFTGNTALVEVLGATDFDFVMFDVSMAPTMSGAWRNSYAPRRGQGRNSRAGESC